MLAFERFSTVRSVPEVLVLGRRSGRSRTPNPAAIASTMPDRGR
jgi:hypothetical protein